MPRATVNATDTEHFDLKTCPDGFVKLRRMSYAEFLKRRDMVSNMGFRGDGRGKSKEFEAFMQMANEKVTAFEFAACIVEHNLEDDNGNQLNFRNPTTLQVLDPRVGEEIGKYINEMNQFEDDDLGNSDNGSPQLSS